MLRADASTDGQMFLRTIPRGVDEAGNVIVTYEHTGDFKKP
jgi:hypothetical protein